MFFFSKKKKKIKPSEVFYIRAHPKSGTNWLCNLVNLHPEINCKGEFHLDQLFQGLVNMKKSKWSVLSMTPSLLEDNFHNLIKNVIIQHCGQQALNGDRTPCTIKSTYIPSVKILYISRDGRDAAVSWAYHALNNNIDITEKMESKRKKFLQNSNHFKEKKTQLLTCKKFLKKFAESWNTFIVNDFEMMQKADRGEIDMPYYWVRYEDLHKNTEHHRKEIYEFLGVNPSLAAPLGERTKAGFKKIDNTKFYRRGAAGIWKEYFTEEQLGWFMEEASEGLSLIQTSK